MPPNEPMSYRPGCLYAGTVMHMRMAPFRHQFRYRVFSLLLDIDRLEDAASGLRWLSVDSFNLLAFHRRDHGARDGSELRGWVDALLVRSGHKSPARVWLLSFPRILGFTFNPLSVYFCEDTSGRLTHIIYEVKNTFGDQHPYVVAVEGNSVSDAFRHDVRKRFFVSPFIGMEHTYRFVVRQPDDRLALKIRQRGPDGIELIATQSGIRRPLTDAALLRLWAVHPLMTVKVVAAIHWQAIRLVLKGAIFRPYTGAYPDPDVTAPTLVERIRAIFGWKRPEISD